MSSAVTRKWKIKWADPHNLGEPGFSSLFCSSLFSGYPLKTSSTMYKSSSMTFNTTLWTLVKLFQKVIIFFLNLKCLIKPAEEV